MATIKLKSSTGTRTVPSSLAQGEMAINVADGNLFYGDNSSNVNNDFRFAQVGVTGLTSGHTVHGVTVSGGSGGVYGTLQTAAQTNITSVGTLGATTLKTVTIAENETDAIPLLITAADGTEGDWVRIGNSSGVFLSIGSGGRTTIASGVFTSASLAGGSINNTPIGASTASTGKFTVATLNNGSVGTPSLNFANDTDTGLRLYTGGQMRLVVAGADQISFTDGAVFPIKGNDIDLGLSSGYHFKNLYIGNITSTGTTNLDVVDIDGAVQVDNTITVGVDDTGYDVKFFGATSGRYLLWDQTNDRLKYRDNVKAVFGHGNDLEIYHDATDNHIEATSTLNISTANSGIAVNIGHTTSETTVNDNLNVTGDLAVDGTSNLDNTDIDGTLVVDGSNISLDSTTTLNIDNSNTSNGITIGTATSGVPVSIGHTTSETTINDNLTVTGNLTSAGFAGTKHVLRSTTVYVNDLPLVQNSLYFGHTSGTQPSNWNDPQACGGVISAVSSFTISEDDMNWGYLLPFDISQVEIQCSLRPNLGNGDDFSLVLYTGIRSDGSSTALTLTKVAISQTTFDASEYRTNDLTYTGNLNKNTMIYVGVGSEDATDAKNARGIMNIVVTQR